MKLNEIIQRVVQGYTNGVPSDESRLSWRRAYSALLSARNLLLSQEAKKRQRVNRWNYQTLCVEMMNAPLNECPGLPAIGCTILRSKLPLPRPLTDYGRHLINSVASFDGNTVFSEIEYEAKKYQSGNKFTSTKPDFYVRNGYIYITTKSKPSIIMVEGVFENPLLAQDFPSACGENPYTCIPYLERDFPVDSDMIPTIVELAIKELGSKKEYDKTNNKLDETT